MSDDLSPVLSLPLIQPAQAQKHVTHNEALRLLDVLVQPAVTSRSTATPPALPVSGARWIVPAGATGAWAGQDGAIALYDQEDWSFLAPQPGWQALVIDEGAPAHWTGSAWVTPADLPQRFARLGVATDADATNRLAVASDATLFTHAGAGHQIKVNKATATDTASLLFQTGWSGRAELGTTGSDGLAIKVSADGTAWTTALSVAPATGQVSLGALQATGPVTGTAVTQTATDTTTGRLMKVGDGGLLGTTVTNNADWDAIDHSGFWNNTTSAPPGLPTTTVNWHMLSLRSSANNQVQVAVQGAGSGLTQGAAFRRKGAGVWGAWHHVVTSQNAIGTVSQAAGVPTGAMFQHGSNANGLFERQANGWQQCLRIDLSAAAISTAEGGMFRSADITWTFPSAFLAGTKPVVQVTGENAALVGFGIVALSASAVTFRVKSATSLASAVTLQASAVGRWSSMT